MASERTRTRGQVQDLLQVSDDTNPYSNWQKVFQILSGLGIHSDSEITMLHVWNVMFLASHGFQFLVRLNFGADMCSPFDFSHHNNESMIRMRYRQNNMYCAQRAPKDKLLVYNVKEGWEPLCAFLGKEVPREPFPHRNIGAVFIEDLKDVHPAMNRIELEWKIVISILIGVGIYTSYKTYRSGCLWNAANFFTSSFRGRFSFV
ncbi:unnamed protein product [Clavelina lepadiformis]|uniref:Uncharacterized protein n=1 Tax=Clavelina lepadiformis TaxID=159417 RepID=A0ABP0GJP7_CLALP